MKASKISSYITIFNLVVTPLIFLPNQSIFENYYFPKHVLIVFCSLLFIFQVWLSRNNLKDLFVWDTSTKAILIYLALVFISLFFAVDIKLALSGNAIRQEGFATIIMYVLMFFAARSSKQLNWKVYVGMLMTATIIAIYGILQHFGFEPFKLEQIRTTYVAYGTIGNRNFFGTYLVLMIPFATHFWYSNSKNVSLVIYGILLFCLIATMSRGPWLGAIGSVSAYLIFRLRVWHEKLFSKKYLYFLLVTIVTLLLYLLTSGDSFLIQFLSIFMDFSKVVVTNPDSINAGSARWFIWSKVIELIRERPFFGFGISNLGSIFNSRYSVEVTQIFRSMVEVDEAHNEYFDIAVSSGIPSLIAYLYFLFTVATIRFKRIVIPNDFNLPILCAIFGYLIQAFFNISVISVMFLFWIFLGLLVQNTSLYGEL